eukprot:jgi/Chlat1/1853/Chrsp141S02183
MMPSTSSLLRTASVASPLDLSDGDRRRGQQRHTELWQPSTCLTQRLKPAVALDTVVRASDLPPKLHPKRFQVTKRRASSVDAQAIPLAKSDAQEGDVEPSFPAEASTHGSEVGMWIRLLNVAMMLAASMACSSSGDDFSMLRRMTFRVQILKRPPSLYQKVSPVSPSAIRPTPRPTGTFVKRSLATSRAPRSMPPVTDATSNGNGSYSSAHPPPAKAALRVQDTKAEAAELNVAVGERAGADVVAQPSHDDKGAVSAVEDLEDSRIMHKAGGQSDQVVRLQLQGTSEELLRYQLLFIRLQQCALETELEEERQLTDLKLQVKDASVRGSLLASLGAFDEGSSRSRFAQQEAQKAVQEKDELEGALELEMRRIEVLRSRRREALVEVVLSVSNGVLPSAALLERIGVKSPEVAATLLQASRQNEQSSLYIF